MTDFGYNDYGLPLLACVKLSSGLEIFLFYCIFIMRKALDMARETKPTTALNLTVNSADASSATPLSGVKMKNLDSRRASTSDYLHLKQSLREAERRFVTAERRESNFRFISQWSMGTTLLPTRV